MRVLLIRHGRSAHVHAGGLVDRAGVDGWRDAYDAAGIAEDDAPPDALLAELSAANVIAASDLPRAIASANRLAGGRHVAVSPLFREVRVPVPNVLPVRAPLIVWNALVHVRWFADVLRGRDAPPRAIDRAREAAAWCRVACERASSDGGTIAVVTHGVFRRLLARELLANAWRAEPGRRSYAHWSVWRLDSPPG